MKLQINSSLLLNNDVSIPRLGLGVYLTPADQGGIDAIAGALNSGYRHFDTAAFYENEAQVGAAVRESDVPREEVFVTTKLWNSDHGYDSTIRAFEESRKLMRFEYIDLYLIHWPVPGKRRDSWKALETLYEERKCRAIGVSNYMIRHLDELLGHATIVPAVNQIELHPFIYVKRKPVVDLCRKNGIAIECYSPLTKGVRLADPGLSRIAGKYGRSTAQILIRWGLQKGFITIPKSARLERIRENAQIYDFSISDDDMDALDALNEGYSCTWDPSDEP